MSLVSGHRFPRDVILLAVRYYLQLGAAAERIAGVLAESRHRRERPNDPALGPEVRTCAGRRRPPASHTAGHDVAGGRNLREDLGKWHYLYRGVDFDGQVLDCWLSATRDLSAADAFFRRTIASTGCNPEHIVTDKATFYASAIRAWAPDARHTATGFYNRVISTNRCERNYGYLKSRLRPMRGLKSVDCAKHLFAALDAMQSIERGFVAASCTGWHTPADGAMCVPAALPRSSTGSANTCRTVANHERHWHDALRAGRPHANVGEPTGLLGANRLRSRRVVAATTGET